MRDAPALKPCPFCGRPPMFRFDGEYASCGSCGIYLPIDVWNTRADIPWLPEDLVELLAGATEIFGHQPRLLLTEPNAAKLIRDILAALEPRAE